MNFKKMSLVIYLLLIVINGVVKAENIENSMENIIRRSWAVVTGEVIKMEPSIRYHYLGYMTASIKVDNVITGKKVEEIIKIDGCFSYDKKNFRMNDDIKFREGEKVLLFLLKVHDPLNDNNQIYDFTDIYNGKFTITNGIVNKIYIPLEKFINSIQNIVSGKSETVNISYFNYKNETKKFCKTNIWNSCWGDSTLWINMGDIRKKDCYMNRKIYINPSGALGLDGTQLTYNQVKKAIERSFQQWNNVPGSFIGMPFFEIGTATSESLDTISNVFWRELRRGVGGTVTCDYKDNNGYAEDADIIFTTVYHHDSAGIEYTKPMRWNWDPDANFPVAPVDNLHGPKDLMDVASHEIGHFYGFADLPNGAADSQTMYYASIRSDTFRRTLESGDMLGCQTIYRKISGTISNNQLWCDPTTGVSGVDYWPAGQTLIVGNTTVSSGVTLTIDPRCVVKFASGTTLTISGTLNAVGTSDKKITFTSINPSEKWGGIVLSGNGASYSTLSYCDLTNIQTSGGAGISLVNVWGNPEISFCNISNVAGATSKGIYFNNSNGYLVKNTINSNYIGVYLDNSSSPTWGKSGYSFSCAGTGNNTVKYNEYGVYVTNSGYANIGSQFEPSARASRIYDNSTANVYSAFDCAVLAEHTYWGAATPDLNKFLVDWTYFYYDPWCSSEPSFSRRVLSDNSAIPSIKISSESSEIGKKIRSAKEYQFNKKFNEAFGIYKGIMDENINVKSGSLALAGLLSLYRDNKDESILNYLETISKTASENQLPATLALANGYTCSGKSDKALNLLTNIQEKFNNPDYSKMAVIQSAYIYYFDLNNKDKADKLLRDLEIKYQPDNSKNEEDKDIAIAKWLIRGNGKSQEGQNNNKGNAKDSQNGTYLADDGLLSNYPNPFNPVTVISYNISKDCQVKLKIYDMLGREVKTLVEQFQSAGNYKVTFDASTLTSGVYYCKLEAGEISSMKRMIFAK